MTAEIVGGRRLARGGLARVVERLGELSRPPGLAVVLARDDPASHIYVSQKARRAR